MLRAVYADPFDIGPLTIEVRGPCTLRKRL
jgi:hypothetical protein